MNYNDLENKFTFDAAKTLLGNKRQGSKRNFGF